MDSYFITTVFPLIGAIFMFLLGLFVFLKRGNTKIGIIFPLFCLAFVVWLFSTFMMYLGVSDSWAIFWDRTVYVGVVFIPILMYHFGLVFSKYEQKQKKILFIGYILSFIFLILSRTNYFVADLYRYDWGVHTQARFLHHIFLIFFFIYILLFLFNLYKRYQDVHGVEQLQTKYVLLAFIIINFGAVAYLPAYGIDFYPISAYLAEIIGAVIIAYAILRYRLMDIRVVLGRGAVYFLSFAAVLSLAFLLIYLNERWLKILPFQIVAAVIIILTVVLFQIIFRFFEKLASKYFYYTFYSYQMVLTDLAKRLTQVLDLDRLSHSILVTLMDTMRLEKSVILLKNPQGENYLIQNNIGFKEDNGISLVEGGFLTAFLQKTKKPLILDEITLIARDTFNKSEKDNLEELKKNMKRIEANLCLPLLFENKIFGMIVLGNKISKDPYSTQDIDLLENLANQASVAFQNAKLYSEMKNFNAKLESEVAKRTKELQKAYNELQKLDKAKSEFLSIASHQLRTPLTAIKGYISMILENTFGQPTEKMQKPLANIYASNERLIKLVNDLLNISRIEAGKITIERQKVSLEKLIESVVQELSVEATRKKIKLKWRKPKEGLPELMLDLEKIRQVILNIIDNAIRYTDKGEVEIKAILEDGAARVSIRDTGAGMTQEEIRQIFHSFSRGKTGSRLWTEGTGLGLYVAKKFVEMHGGDIWTESAGRNKGSVFHIKIPIK